jgi:hypothetical protein
MPRLSRYLMSIVEDCIHVGASPDTVLEHLFMDACSQVSGSIILRSVRPHHDKLSNNHSFCH